MSKIKIDDTIILTNYGYPHCSRCTVTDSLLDSIHFLRNQVRELLGGIEWIGDRETGTYIYNIQENEMALRLVDKCFVFIERTLKDKEPQIDDYKKIEVWARKMGKIKELKRAEEEKQRWFKDV